MSQYVTHDHLLLANVRVFKSDKLTISPIIFHLFYELLYFITYYAPIIHEYQRNNFLELLSGSGRKTHTFRKKDQVAKEG